MKRYFNKIALLSLVAGLMSCSEDYLETQPTEFISGERIEEVAKYNPEIAEGQLLGLYSLMYEMETGGTTGHDDFGHKGYNLYSDLLCGDMVLGGYNYGWYSDIANYSSPIDYTDTDNYKPWRYYYRIIRGANAVIDGLGGNDAELPTEDMKFSMGQAKAMRAFAYYNLVNLYGTEYVKANEVLPIYTSTEDPAKPLSTYDEVYTLIKSDLEAAVTLLDGFTRSAKHIVDKNVAEGLLAYVYLTLGDYANASKAAASVITNSGYTMLEMAELTKDGFNNVASHSWVWGVDLTLDQGLDLVSWWGQVDIFTYSYAWAGDPKTMDMGLYESMRATDARRKQFLDPWSEGLNYPANKFFAPERKIGGQREVTTDYVFMRIEEMYLVKAEAEAFAGNDAIAKEALFELVSRRDSIPEYVNSLSGQALKDEIYKQTRLELWGEGKSYLAMKRNKATIVREGHIELNGIPIPYNDDRLTFDIPYQEIQDNPFIDFQK